MADNNSWNLELHSSPLEIEEPILLNVFTRPFTVLSGLEVKSWFHDLVFQKVINQLWFTRKYSEHEN